MNLVVLAPGLLLAAILAAPAATPLSANLDARPLNHAETATYLPLICSGKISKGDGFDHNCQALFEYSASHAEGAGSYNLSLSSIIHGHLTDPISDQAFVSYSSDFESEATNSGGGILFQNGPAGWRLVRWYPGENFDGCLQLNPTGKAKMLCLFFHYGQGEASSSLWLQEVPSVYTPDGDGSASMRPVLKAQDDRDAGPDGNYNCEKVRSSSQSILFSIDDLMRKSQSGALADVKLSYVKPASVAAFCKKDDLAHAPVTTQTVKPFWDGTNIEMSQNFIFSPTDY